MEPETETPEEEENEPEKTVPTSTCSIPQSR